MAPRSHIEPPPFRKVFDTHVDYVWRVFRHLGVRERDLDDMVQEAFVVVHRRLPDWRPEAKIESWLWVICRNLARDHRKRAHVRREHPTEAPPETEHAAAPDAAAEARAALRRVELAVADLDEGVRAVFLLYELEGWAMNDIADTLSIPRKTAYSRLRLAREHLRRSTREGKDHE